ncbi:hypothetical protein EJ03DRAFT_153354 [Teratosphaeria nubilosa]|uniref:Uncharacterized protein n=1 Tax=Teratosphaeria nubilosa TaxID=161662 RepID=A0A6G1LJL0_9PEZI|nr:hypothetical protein EJ03DRAFT_153354 [Teratosphaeria nubilosa]
MPELISLKLDIATRDEYILGKRDGGSCSERKETMLHHHAKNIANKVFGTVGPLCVRFVALALNFTHVNSLLRQDVVKLTFVRGKQFDLYGNLGFIGLPMETSLIKYHEPCSEIIYE